MDYDQFAATCKAVFADIAPHLPGPDRDMLTEFRDVGEWGEFLDNLTLTLAEEHIPVTTRQRDYLGAVLDYAKLPTDILTRLTISDPTADHTT